MSDPVYCYPPDYSVLKNLPGYRDQSQLDAFERAATLERSRQGIPTGNFDLKHLQAIHGHLFQDVYAWAGKLRTVEIEKGGHQFQFRQYIETGMADIYKRLKDDNFLKGRSAEAFAKGAGEIIGDVNYVHPFRDGNGRTQLQYLKLLGAQAGHELDLARLERSSWIEASREAHKANYKPMSACIASTVAGRTPHTPEIEALKKKLGDIRPSQVRSRDVDDDRSR
ncbi:MAG: Fic family protein [Chloroflexota bacterium]